MSTETKFTAIAALAAKAPLVPFAYVPKALRDTDVEVAIHACGVCHTDLHQVNNDWNMSTYPIVPGHEIIGTIVKVGSAVTEVKLGQRVGVPLQISQCNECPSCLAGESQLCKKQTWVYGYPTGDAIQPISFGGFASHLRVDQHWAFPIPEELSDAGAAPLLCAGATMWSPFVHHKITSKHRVGIIGVGGLGHLGVQFAVKHGCHTTGISTSANKKDEILAFGTLDLHYYHYPFISLISLPI
jgi:D-arabinose 1-dehydrogenase-like Zn-dependent alcohol dehydrogenase